MNYHDIRADALPALLAESELLILDFRDPASFAQGHLDDAQPVSDALLHQLMKTRARARPVLVYCYRGNSSRDLCQFIAGFGYSRVYNLVDGWEGWQRFTQAASSSPALAAWLAGRLSARHPARPHRQRHVAADAGRAERRTHARRRTAGAGRRPQPRQRQ